MNLEIIYSDEHLVAINKPHGLLVHRSKIAADASEFAIQILRNQIGKRVTPVHRIDRKTSGILVFALTYEANRALNLQFDAGSVKKKYYAIVRGYTADDEIIDYPLLKENGSIQEAVTYYKTLQRVELPIALGKHETQRYSLIEVSPKTGRKHQIRRHMNHLRHPIIGDRPHGCNKQNKLFKEKWDVTTMQLHAAEIEFQHPISLETIHLTARMQSEMKQVYNLLGFNFFEDKKA